MKRALLFAVAVVTVAHVAHADDAKKAPSDKFFYVYHDKADLKNHYCPSGWMGDYGDLKLNEGDTTNPYDGRTDVEVTYNAKAAQGANWAGIFWQNPPNNWGEKPGGYDLTGFKRLTFYARGDRPIKMAEFKVGGINGDHGDSDSQSTGPVDVTTKWQKFTIDLTDKNLSHIVGAFCWSASKDDNPEGFKLYLDEIRYER